MQPWEQTHLAPTALIARVCVSPHHKEKVEHVQLLVAEAAVTDQVMEQCLALQVREVEVNARVHETPRAINVAQRVARAKMHGVLAVLVHCLGIRL